jgi:hypothetical protein
MISAICREVARLDDRNHIVHGIWGMHTDDKGKARAGSFFRRKGVDAQLYADRLKDLCERVADVTRDLGKLLSKLNKKFVQQDDAKVVWFSRAPAGETRRMVLGYAQKTSLRLLRPSVLRLQRVARDLDVSAAQWWDACPVQVSSAIARIPIWNCERGTPK